MKKGKFKILGKVFKDKKLCPELIEKSGFIEKHNEHTIGLYYQKESMSHWIATHLQSGFMIGQAKGKLDCLWFAKLNLDNKDIMKKGQETIDKVFKQENLTYPLIPFNN